MNRCLLATSHAGRSLCTIFICDEDCKQSVLIKKVEDHYLPVKFTSEIRRD